MVDSTQLPYHPRLAEHAWIRRHFIDDVEVIVIHDARSGALVRMPPRAYNLIEAADGTRDVSGLLLAASQNGELAATSEVISVLTDLHSMGLLSDGIDPFALTDAAATREEIPLHTPLSVFPFLLTCDGTGGCCSLYSTVRFTKDEAMKASVLLPNAEQGRVRKFLPLQGSGAQLHMAATVMNGRCGFLAKDHLCELHRTLGVAAKPVGCSLYPATFVYDGEKICVSLGVECGCIEKSFGKTTGTPLVSQGALLRSDLPAGAEISMLPPSIEIAPGKATERTAIVEWSRTVLSVLAIAKRNMEPMDIVSTFWALATRVNMGDLSEDGIRQSFASLKKPDLAELLPWAEALCERALAKSESANAWRSEKDRVRVVSALLLNAAKTLRDPDVLLSLLNGANGQNQAEEFYFQTNVFGYALLGEIPLAQALFDRALRLLLARNIRRQAADIPVFDPGNEHPISLVEAMMRAQGVKEYVRAVFGAGSGASLRR